MNEAFIKKREDNRKRIAAAANFGLECEKDTAILSKDIQKVLEEVGGLNAYIDRFVDNVADINRTTENRLLNHPRIASKLKNINKACADFKMFVSRTRLSAFDINAEVVEQNVRRRLKK